MKQYLFLPLMAAALCSVMASCQKNESTPVLRVRLTDAPTALDAVNVDLKQVTVKMEGDTSRWIALPTKAGIYNLLGLQNGVDTLIAEGQMGEGAIKEIRLVLGSDNSVVANGSTFPLTIPSGSESGLKIKVGKQIRNNLDSLLIDFDAALSVRQESNGYKLRPVLRIK